jgi:GWxTD domain-containing protein
VDSLRAETNRHLRSGRQAEALVSLNQYVESGESEPLNHIWVGQSFTKLGERKRAVAAYKRAVKSGQEVEGYNGIGLVYLASGKNPRRAEANFRKALKRDRGFAEAQYNIGRLYLKHRPGKAREAFEKTLELDSSHLDTHYQIGMLFEKEGRPLPAVESYKKQLLLDPAHGRAALKLAKVYARQDEAEAAVTLLTRLAKSGQEPAAYRELALIRMDDGEFESAQNLFDQYINTLPGSEQRKWRDIALVADKEERKSLENAPGGEEGLEGRYWSTKDPAPLTRANERLLEHYRRVSYAREHYPRGEDGWDKRGEIFIRFGAPDHISSWEDINNEMERSVQDARVAFANRSKVGLRISPGQPIFPVPATAKWEYWIYVDIEGGIEITFVKEFNQQEYEFARLPLGISPSLGVEIAKLQSGVLVEAMAARLPAVYTPDFADLPIDFYYYPAGFRGTDSRTRLEIYYGLPAAEISRLNVDEKTDLILLDRGVVLYDSSWNEVYRVTDQLAFSAPSDKQISEGAFIPGALPVELAPGTYKIALQIRDVVSRKSQVYQQLIELEDYGTGDALRISDIELAFSISEARDKGEFTKNGLKVIPMSSRSFRNDQSAFVYFEIYNLRLDGFGQTRYRVEYTLRSHEKRSAPGRILHGLGRAIRVAEKDQEIVISYDQVGEKSDEVAYVELDLSETKTGGQLVRVAVTDLVSESAASKEITFRIVP